MTWIGWHCKFCSQTSTGRPTRTLLNNLSVVNDPAERMILLVTERITTVRSEVML